ncbi:unnamed protein product [Cylindrotheca closterium]|uniref:Uncharacterized protein n=1 Tax=Cylindrotheca closterium TaxID=2856 RepID=A0AAD2CDW6_9STRA|nr:unnamed protein product [Cylindrotheca closterium]
MNKQKLQLRSDLHEFLESKQQSIRLSTDLEKKRSGCVDVLEEIEFFLVAWAEFEDSSGLPDQRLKQTLSWIVSVLGPGDPQLRDHLWDTLVATGASTSCRLVILDFLAATIPPGTNEDERFELIRILKQVFNDDSNLVGPVLNCIDSIYEAGGLEHRDIFQFALDMLPKEHESRIHLIINFLVKHISNGKNATTVVESIRAEMQAIEETESPEAFVFPTCQLFCELWNVQRSKRFFDIYLDILGGGNMDGEDDNSQRVLVLDMIVLLLAGGESTYHSIVEGIIDSNLMEKYFSSKLPCFLLSDGIWREVRTPLLIGSLISACITTLSSPFRTRSMENLERHLDTSRRFICQVFRALRDNGKACKRLAVSMINLANAAKETIDSESGLFEKNDEAADAIYSCIFGALDTAVWDGSGAMTSTKSFIRKHLLKTLSTGQHNDVTLEQVCATLCNLEPKDDNKVEKKVLFQLLQSLLFSSTPSVSEKQTIQKCRAGFLLASSMITNIAALDEKSIAAIWNILKSVLLPPSTRMVNPTIGLQGLEVARKLCASTKTSLSLKRQVFHTVTHMVSKTKLIQYAANFEERRRQDVALAYTDQEGVLKSPRKSTNTRKMVFCFDALIQDDALLDSSNWRSVIDYVLTLIDTYLAIGRQPKDSARSQSWTPKPWIEGAIELTLLDMTKLKMPTTKKRELQDMLKIEMGKSFSNLHTPSRNNNEKTLLGVIQSIKTDVDFQEIIHSMLRLTLSLIISQAILVAVINNTFGQYEGFLNDHKNGVPKEASDALRLIHLQLAKSYDLRKRCKTIQKTMKAMVSRKSGKRSGRKRLKISRLSNNEMVRAEMLWNAITDPIHDAKLIELVDPVTESRSVPSAAEDEMPLLHVVEMRLKILDHLLLHFGHWKEVSGKGSHKNILKLIFGKGRYSMITRCLRLASHLSLRLAALAEGERKIGDRALNSDSASLDEKLTQLTAAYFNLLSSATALLLETQREQIDPQLMTSWNLLALFSSALRSKSHLREEITIDDDGTKPPFESFQRLISPFRSHLSICRNDLVRFELLEILSVFCIELGDDAITAMVDVSSDFLHSTAKTSSVGSHPPYSLRLATQRLLASVDDEAGEEKELVQSLLGFESRTGLLKSASRDPSTTFGMLRHWGILAVGSRQSAELHRYLHHLLSNATIFIGNVPDLSVNKKETAEAEEAASEDGEHMPCNEPSIKTVDLLAKLSIPGISADSFVVYFELTLQMIVASTSVFSLSSKWEGDDEQHPFDRLTRLFDVYGSSISIYLQKCHAFPTQTLQVIVKSSRDILKAAIIKLRSCMRWRNLQPVVLVHEMDDEKDDVASPRHLKRLLDSIDSNVVARIQSMCKELPRLKTFKGYGSLQKLKSLRAQAERIQAELQTTSSVLHLSDLQYDQKSDEVHGASVKRGRHTDGAVAHDIWQNNHSPRKKPRTVVSLPPGFNEVQRDGISLSSEQSQDSSYSSNGSRSFGASGNWGEESEEMSESGDEILLKSKWIQGDDERGFR